MSAFLPLLLLLVLAAPPGDGAPEPPTAGPAEVAAEDSEALFEAALAALLRAREAFEAVGADGDLARLAWLPRMSELADRGSSEAAAWLLQNDPGRPADGKRLLYERLAVSAPELLLAPEALATLRRDAGALGRDRALDLAGRIRAAASGDEQEAAAVLALAHIQEDGRVAEPFRKQMAVELHREVVERFPRTASAVAAGESLWRLDRLEIGRVAPDFVTRDVDGNEIRISDLTRRVVVLEFWSFSDPGIAARIARRRALHQGRRDERFALIGINLDSDELAYRRALEELDIRWPNAFEAGRRQVWKIRRGPRTFVLDRERIIRFVDVDGAELDAAVEQLLQKRKGKPAKAGE